MDAHTRQDDDQDMRKLLQEVAFLLPGAAQFALGCLGLAQRISKCPEIGSARTMVTSDKGATVYLWFGTEAEVRERFGGVEEWQ